MNTAFARALLNPQQPCPGGLRTWNASDPAARFAVYRNNVMVSLLGALADTFPVTRQVAGETFFNAIGRLYVAASPPRHAVLNAYGDTLPDFIDAFEPAQALPHLSDLARLELLRVRAFHAADAEVLSAAQVAAKLADPQSLPQARMRLHPSLAVFHSRFGVVSLWAAHQDVRDLAGVDLSQPESALVQRSGDDVAVIPIAPASAEFFRRLLGGDSLGEASAAAMAGDDPFDLPGSLSILIHHGALSAWS